MAPEIMQLQKYDAKVTYIDFNKLAFFLFSVYFILPYEDVTVNFYLLSQADLWSVGAILFQLVTGKTPFTGNNQIQVCLEFCVLSFQI